ncbi:DUF378 domain-containing protein [Candidatus Microgenomates bacterium]|nr:DUF378 domain-containing protein [Candidatus Microgenomates bacterium]
MKMLHFITFTLVVIGGINWGLIGLSNLNLINSIFASAPSLEKIVYILVGISALYLILTHKNDCKICGK